MSVRAGRLGMASMVTPLRLNLIEKLDLERTREDSISVVSGLQDITTYRDRSSMESLEYQDRYSTPRVGMESDSDVERAKIVEEAAVIAEKLMNSHFSKVSFESELRTMETRYPTRANSPRYYDEKRQVIDRANKLLTQRAADYSIPAFFHSKFNWFGCMEGILSGYRDDEIVERGVPINVAEVNPYVSPKKIVFDRMAKIEQGKAGRGNKLESGKDKSLERSSATEISTSSLSDSSKQLRLIQVKSAKSKKMASTELRSKTDSLSEKNHTRGARISEEKCSENDIFCLDDGGAGYITLNTITQVFPQAENKIYPGSKQKGQHASLGPVNPSRINSDSENQSAPVSTVLNKSVPATKKPIPRSRHKTQTQTQDQGGDCSLQKKEKSYQKKECKKRIKLLNKASIETSHKLGAESEKKSKSLNDSPSKKGSFNYSSNFIRGRMDYVSTDVFV